MYISGGHWYSIIRYTPSKIKNETINIGILFYSDVTQQFDIELLSIRSPKIKAILNNPNTLFDYSIVEEVLFDTILDLNENSLFSTALLQAGSEINTSIQENITRVKNIFILVEKQLDIVNVKLSLPVFAQSESLQQIRKVLFGQLVYEDPAKKIKRISISKQNFEDRLLEKNLMDNKVKKEIMIQPVKQIDRKYKTDFAYLNGRMNFIFFAPEESSNLDNWQDRIMNLNRNLSNEALIKVIYSESSMSNKDKKVSDLLSYLQEERLDSFEKIEVSNIETEIHKIERHAQPSNLLNEQLKDYQLIS